MKSTKKIVTFNLLTNIVLWGALFAGTHYLVFKPLFEDLDRWAKKTSEVEHLYKPASEGDPASLARLEQITHENNGLAYLMMISIERKNAIKASGIDLMAPDANVEAIDVSKTQALLLQAMRELSDLELYGVLKEESPMFDKEQRDLYIRFDVNSHVWTKNTNRYVWHSTLDKATQDRLLHCKNKLESTYNNTLLAVLNLRARGACSDVPTETSYSNLFEKNSNELQPMLDSMKAARQSWRGVPSAT